MKRLHLDIETCPNVCFVWSCGWRIDVQPSSILEERRIITAAFKWDGKAKIYDEVWDRNREDEKLVNNVTEVMNEADEIVAHYGDGFDIPWLRTRSMKHGIVVPNWKSVDTKAWAAKYFFLNSNKLDYLAQFLGIGTKIRTEYDLWKDATKGSDKISRAAVDKMRRYNRHDTYLLEPVYGKLSHYCPLPTHAGVLMGNARYSCPKCGSEQSIKYCKPTVSRAGLVKHEMLCKACPKYFVIPNVAYQAWLKAQEADIS